MDLTIQLRKLPSKTRLINSRGGHHQTVAPKKSSKKRKHLYSCRRNDRCVCAPMAESTFEFPRIWRDFRINGQLVDGVVRCLDGTEFKVHRAILSAASSYFRALFTNSINRGQPENHEANVNVPGATFEVLLDYAYTGVCPINSANVKTLLKYADQYEILGVVQNCCSFLLDELSPKNCFGILRFANDYFCKELIKKGRRFIRSNFSVIVSESKEFNHMDLNELVDLLKDDELNIKTEETVFDSIVKWINHDPLLRQKYLGELLKCVRFGSLPRNTISTIMRHPLIESEPDCQEYLNEVILEIGHLMCTGHTDTSISLNFRPRVSYDVLFAMGGWSAGSPTNFVETYDVKADRWLLSADTDSVPRAYHGLCTLNNLIYVVGGFDGVHYFNTVRKFNPATHLWSDCACMYCYRCYVSVVKCEEKIYAMGGFNGRNRMNSCERYDPGRNQWEMIPPMQKPRSDASAASLKDKIYIVGGFNGQEVMRSAEVFDVRENQWTYIPQMITARSGVSLIVFENILYALGGFNGYARLTTSEKYSPGGDTWWSEVAEMATPRSNFATVILDDYIYVIGGFNENTHLTLGSSTINNVEYYDPEIDAWYEAAPMNLNRSALSACVIHDLPNIKEYSVVSRSLEERGQGADTNLTRT